MVEVEGIVPVLFHADPDIDSKCIVILHRSFPFSNTAPSLSGGKSLPVTMPLLTSPLVDAKSDIWLWQGPTAQLQVRVPRPELRIFDLVRLLGGLLDPGQVRLEPEQFDPWKDVTKVTWDSDDHPDAEEIAKARYELSRILVYYTKYHSEVVTFTASRPSVPSLTVSEKGVAYGSVRKYIGCRDPQFLGDWDEHDAEHLRRLLNVKFFELLDDAAKAGNIPLHDYWLKLSLQTRNAFGPSVE